MYFLKIKDSFFIQLFLFFFFSFNSISQVNNANWTSHFSYNSFVDVVASDQKLYVAASNSVFIYDNEINQTNEFTTVQGLSGEEISVLYYSERFSTLIIGYENGLLETLNEVTGEISTYVDIERQTNFSPSSLTINNFFEDVDLLYIATGFGVVTFNLSTSFFGDTFLISDSQTNLSNVKAVGVFEDQIIASIEGKGVFTANKNEGSLLLDFSSWTNIQDNDFLNLVSLGNRLIAYDGLENLYSYTGSVFDVVYVNSEDIFEIKSYDNMITLNHSSASTILDTNFMQVNFLEYPVENDITIPVKSAIYLDSQLFYGVQGLGFYKTIDQSFAQAVIISPAGPQTNSPKKMDLFDGDLWISYETVSLSFNDSPLTRNGVDKFSDNTWTSISIEELGLISIVDVDIDRKNKDLVYISGYRNGLVKYNNGVLDICTNDNSDIEPSLITTFNGVYSFFYDERNDETWIIDPFTRKMLKKVNENCEEVQSLDLSTIIGENDRNYIAEEMLIDSNENIFFGTFRNGLVGYSQSLRKYIEISELETHNMPDPNVKELAIDKNGELWVGTISGIRKYSNPDQIFLMDNLQAESIIFEDQGIAQELLFQQYIRDIKVDGNNNKWIATNDGGVFYVSEDGQETIYNFTTENSPLPSNIVVDIAIDESTGSVFFATEKGLMEFNSNVTTAAEDFSSFKVFPNPVRPEYGEVNVTIQGLTAGANVKITDIEGNLVYEAQNEIFDDGGSGTILWDTRSFSGKKVASGVYLLLITGEDALETKVEKLLIVR